MAAGNIKGNVVVRFVRWMHQALKEVLLAVHEHHHWVSSPRARVLEEWTARGSALLHYAAYLLFALLAYQLWTSFAQTVTKTSATGLFAAADALDFRTSLFYVFAGAFLIPAGLFVVWFVVKWSYKLLESVVNRRLPRFMRLPFYPLVLCGVALMGLGYQKPVATLMARVYVEAREVVMIAEQSGAGPRELVQAGSLQPAAKVNTQSEKLIEELRKHYEDRSGQPPPEPFEMELDASRGKRTKVD
jgi:hypothetical protein